MHRWWIVLGLVGAMSLDSAWSAPAKNPLPAKKGVGKGKASREPEVENDRGAPLGDPVVKYWQVGVRLEAVAGPCGNIQCSIPVPMDWKEQQVKIVQEDVSPLVDGHTYRILEGGVRQMLVTVGRLNPGRPVHAIVTFQVTTQAILPPTKTELLKIPENRSITRDLKRNLMAGSYMEIKHPLIRKALAEAVPDKSVPVWEQVRAIYDHVREKVEYREGPLKGGVQALQDGHGDCESMTCLFVAMCRANRIPARMVWVVDHAYPEFYLVDDEGQGHWFPCQVAGTEAFGAMPDPRPILQRGEDFVVPGQKGRQHYVSEFLIGTPARGARQPKVEFIRRYVDGFQPAEGESAAPTLSPNDPPAETATPQAESPEPTEPTASADNTEPPVSLPEEDSQGANETEADRPESDQPPM